MMGFYIIYFLLIVTMQTKDLAQQLKISPQMCNRLIKRGMPTDSLEAAIQWRAKNLDVTQTKSWRVDGNTGVKTGISKPKQTTKNQPVDHLQLDDNDTGFYEAQLSLTPEEVDALHDDWLDFEKHSVNTVYKNAKALKERSLALMAVSDYKKMRKSLVEKSEVERFITIRGQQIGELLTELARKVAPVIAGKSSIAEIESILSGEIRAMLIAAADLPPIER